MKDLIILAAFNIPIAGIWIWICFYGGDRKWSAQVQGFWHREEYKWLTPKTAKLFVTLLLAAIIIGDIAVILTKLK